MNKILFTLLFISNYTSNNFYFLNDCIADIGVHGIFLSNKRNHLVFEIAINMNNFDNFNISYLKKSYAIVMVRHDFSKMICCITGVGWYLQKGFLFNSIVKFNIKDHFAFSFGVKCYFFGYNDYYTIEPTISVYLFNYKKNSILISGSYVYRFYKSKTNEQTYQVHLFSEDDENYFSSYTESSLDTDNDINVSRWQRLKGWTNVKVKSYKNWVTGKKNEKKD